MTHEIISVLCGGAGFSAPGISANFRQYDNRHNQYPPRYYYQDALMTSKADILIYVHDDVKIHDKDWLERVMEPFEDVNTVAVGLGGAMSLGTDDLYSKPFDINNMRRGGYMSNQDDWEVHGTHETGKKLVVVLDAFFMAVRREWLLTACMGRWPKTLTHHCLDLWLACEASYFGYKTYMVGVSCIHHGGGTSAKPVYEKAPWLQGALTSIDHHQPHKWLYHTYAGVLPLRLEIK